MDRPLHLLLTFVAVLIGGFLALLGYDHWVLKPRADTQARTIADLQARPAAQPAALDLDSARSEADAIAGKLDADLKRSVAENRAAIEQTSREQQMRQLGNDALARANMPRVAITEFYMTNNQWPADASAAGLGSTADLAGGAVKAVTIGPQGTIALALREPLSSAGRIVMTPVAKANGMIEWRCATEGDDNLARYVAGCR
ncbi:pilin [Montanilutibacter psychrotolerans]|uniref:Fimbrial protein n=1 Tax=Montanilutibacter psychrotolerans TaxID=1327343 RepID=A0A3M8T4G9_9GAMM|nr:pilin [Lysobacter psychrotolerans]RNF86100.1 hypothetical protein EER27_01300 [Lysobacter psychrotolerans]